MNRTLLWLLLALAPLVSPTVATAQIYEANPKWNGNLTVFVEDAARVADRLTKRAAELGGRTVSEARDTNGNFGSATIVVEVPRAKFDDMVGSVRRSGKVQQESITFDQLKKAGEGSPFLVRIFLTERESQGHGRSRASFLAGVVGGSLNVSGLGYDGASMPTAGLTVSTFGRGAQLSILLVKEPDAKDETPATGTTAADPAEAEKGGDGSSLVMISHHTYSNALGGGQNRFLNPYAGITYGYARLSDVSLVGVGATLGVELVKLDLFVLGLSGELLGLYNARNGGNAQLYTLNAYLPF